MPNEEISSNEAVRPFVILQPLHVGKDLKHERAKSFVPQRKEKWNPICEPPKPFAFRKEINLLSLERYPGKIYMSKATVSEMQRRSAVYLNNEDNIEYKSLYGERDPDMEAKRKQ